MRSSLLFISIVSTLLSCNMIGGSGRIVSEKRNLSGFTGIETTSFVKVEVALGDSFNVEVEADDNILDRLNTEVDDGVLVIEMDKGGYSNVHATVYVTAPEINKMIVSGSGGIETKGKVFSRKRVELAVRGSGSMNADIRAPTVNIENAGSGSITVKGETKTVKIKGSGSGLVNCAALLAEYATVKTTGSGGARVFASLQLEADLNGSGDIVYLGNPPNMKIEDDGSGEIKAASK
jgi:hypothetical protein